MSLNLPTYLDANLLELIIGDVAHFGGVQLGKDPLCVLFVGPQVVSRRNVEAQQAVDGNGDLQNFLVGDLACSENGRVN